MLTKLKNWSAQLAGASAIVVGLTIGGMTLLSPVSASTNALPKGCSLCMNCHPSMGGTMVVQGGDTGWCMACCQVP